MTTVGVKKHTFIAHDFPLIFPACEQTKIQNNSAYVNAPSLPHPARKKGNKLLQFSAVIKYLIFNMQT